MKRSLRKHEHCNAQGDAPPPLSPVHQNGAALMEANASKPATPEPRLSQVLLHAGPVASCLPACLPLCHWLMQPDTGCCLVCFGSWLTVHWGHMQEGSSLLTQSAADVYGWRDERGGIEAPQ